MNLYGWDLLFATNLSVINEKFQQNNAYLSSSFNFESTDPFFKTKVNISGQFGKWSIAGKNSNSLINVTLPVNGLNISGMASDNITNASFTLVVGLDLNFISDKNNANKKNLQFNYSGDGSNSGSNDIRIVSMDAGSSGLTEAQKSFASQAIKICLEQNPDKLNYIFASVLLKNEQANWLSPDNISFDLVNVNNGPAYFCIFGSTGPKTGQAGQVDGSIFNGTDNMYLGISAPLFLERIIMPGIRKALSGSNPIFANPKIVMSSYVLPDTKVGAITYNPVILYMTMEVSGSQIVTKLSGICDLKANITMSFTYSSNSQISVNKSNRTISVINDPNPVFDHSLDIPWYEWLGIGIIGPIALGIAAIVTSVISNAIADSIKSYSNSNVLISTESISWSNIDFKTISNGALSDNFYITGISN